MKRIKHQGGDPEGQPQLQQQEQAQQQQQRMSLQQQFLALKSLPRRGNRYRWREQQEEETEEGTEEGETEGNQMSLYRVAQKKRNVISNRSH